MIRYFCPVSHLTDLMPFYEGSGWYSFTKGEWLGPFQNDRCEGDVVTYHDLIEDETNAIATLLKEGQL